MNDNTPEASIATMTLDNHDRTGEALCNITCNEVLQANLVM